MTREQIMQAVARGWCSTENSGKEMDTVLANAIAGEVLTALRARASSEPGEGMGEQRYLDELLNLLDGQKVIANEEVADCIRRLRAALEKVRGDLKRARNEADINMENFKVTNRALVDYDRKRLAAEQRALAAEAALLGVACRTDGDGKPCWCDDTLHSGLFAPSHTGFCLNARRALRSPEAEA